MDVNIIRRAQSGDSDALTQIYDGMYKRVYYLALRLTKNQEDAEDATQETFISAFGALEGLGNPEAFESWIFQIASNKCRNILRKNSHTVDLTEDEDGNTILDDMADPNEALIPESVMENSEQRRLIMETIQELPQTQRECVLMFYYSGLGVKEIAEDLGCSEGTVKSRLNYARQKIKESILSIEKRDGIRLHSIAPIGLLLMADFNAAAGGISIPALGAAGAAAAGTAGVAGTAAVSGAGAAGSGAAGAAGTAAAATATAGGSAGSTAATVAGVALKTKIIAGVAAGAVLTGGGAAVVHQVTKEEAPPPIEYVEFVDENMEHNMHILLDIPEEEGIPVETLEECYEIWFVDDGMTFRKDEFAEGWIDRDGNWSAEKTPGAKGSYMLDLFVPEEGTVPVYNFEDLEQFGEDGLSVHFLHAESGLDLQGMKKLFPDGAVRNKHHDNVGYEGGIYDIFTIYKDPEFVEFSDPNMENNMHILLGIPHEDPITRAEMRKVGQISLSAQGMSYFNGREWHEGPYSTMNDVMGTLPVSNYEDFKYLGRELVVTVYDEDFVDEDAILRVSPDTEFHYPFRDGLEDENILHFSDPAMEYNLHLLLGIPEGEPILRTQTEEIIELFFFNDGMNLSLSDDHYIQTQVHDLPSVQPAEGTLPVQSFDDVAMLGEYIIIVGIMDYDFPLDEFDLAGSVPHTFYDVQDYGEGKYIFMQKAD